jgi:ABC-2 type transport system permease protein
MAVELLRRGAVDRLRSLAFWCAGVAGYIVLVSAIFPSLKGSADLDKLLKDYPDALKQLLGISGSGSLSSGAGFLDAELFGLMLPILIIVMAVAGGAGLFAGEEDAGRLELILSYPVSRPAAVLAKGGAVALEVVALAVAAGIAIAVVDPIFGLDLCFRHLVGAIVELTLIGLFYGWLALAVGAATGNRAVALGAAAGFAVAGYLVSGLHTLAGWLDPFRFLSAFWWLGASPLENGIDGWGALVVGAASVVVLGAGAFLVTRRDLQVP